MWIVEMLILVIWFAGINRYVLLTSFFCFLLKGYISQSFKKISANIALFVSAFDKSAIKFASLVNTSFILVMFKC